MSAQPEALRLADLLEAAVQTYPQMSEDEPGGYATEVDQVMDDAAAELRRPQAENEAQAALLRRAVDAWDSTEIDTDPVAAVIEAIRLHLEAKE